MSSDLATIFKGAVAYVITHIITNMLSIAIINRFVWFADRHFENLMDTLTVRLPIPSGFSDYTQINLFWFAFYLVLCTAIFAIVFSLIVLATRPRQYQLPPR